MIEHPKKLEAQLQQVIQDRDDAREKIQELEDPAYEGYKTVLEIELRHATKAKEKAQETRDKYKKTLETIGSGWNKEDYLPRFIMVEMAKEALKPTNYQEEAKHD